MEDLLINYTPNERSMRAAFLSSYRFWKTMLWMALAFGGLMAVTKAGEVDWRDVGVIVSWLLSHVVLGLGFGIAMALAFRYLLLPLQARSLFRKNAALFGPSSLKADGEGLTFATSKTSASFAWADLRGYQVVKDAVVVATRGTAYYAVPTAGTAPSDLAVLRRLLESRLPKLKR